ncbi:ribosome small subunit-dependent GTPase A [Spirillospora albida]|uniref:ribosome small subunit-dependent GTPase A n=1 Tax=Spirillospora albida TaxID=58123 RepID=UPI0004C21BE0|nr:ribosome small subunit-dependent GTPase A [Spirillospora albida]
MTSHIGSLAAYGWDETLESSFTEHRASGLVPARVIAVDRGRCDAATADGVVRATVTAAPGTTRSGRPPESDGPDPAAPCTGDWAALRPDGPDGLPAVAAVLPRRTAIIRGSAGDAARPQVLAANVDTVAVIVALSTRLALGRVERLVALGWESGARPAVILTQADLHPDPGEALAEVAAAAPGIDVVACSAATGDGIDTVRAVLTGTVVLIGPSGAGKSTLGNALLGGDPAAGPLATGAVRAGDGKGRHTTVRRELLPLPGGGVLIDTPGLRGVGLFDAADGLRRAFTDIEELAAACRFADCGHATEPGCAVLAAVDDGTLPARRLDSYRRLQRENDWIASRADARLRAERENRWKSIRKAQRRMYREQGRDR